MKFLYDTALGRFLLKLAFHTGALRLLALLLHTPLSKLLIKPFTKKYNISLTGLCKEKFDSFADFFSRQKKDTSFVTNPSDLISPCDGLLSVFPISGNEKFQIKNSLYSINDLVTDKEQAKYFENGLCMIYRLRANDYHRFCYIDDCYHHTGHFVPGLLHSVQPIACEKEPVYRLNRRMWSIMDTKNFGKVAQIEVGAVLVGGIVHEKENAPARRGEEMGRFELAGSTIILLFDKTVRDNIKLHENMWNGLALSTEIPVKMGQSVGTVKQGV